MSIMADKAALIKELSPEDKGDDDKQTIKFEDWGFNIDRLFEVAYRFYKRNESKAFHPSFDVRNQMNALILQARYGDHDGGKAPELGVLDFIGKRRHYEWSVLKGMSKTEAMSKFICNLDELCPLFKAHAEAVKIVSGYDSPDINKNIENNLSTNGHKGMSLPSPEVAEQLKTIYSSLCRQTQNQFKSYAKKQYPDDIPQQKYLIKSLQEQYFHQYVSQMHPEMKDSLTVSITDQKQANDVQTNGNIPSSIPSPSMSEKSRDTTTTPEIESKISAKIETVIGDCLKESNKDALETVADKIRTVNLSNVSNKTQSSDNSGTISIDLETSQGQHDIARTSLMTHDNKMNLGESEGTVELIEADISCEELNASDLAPAEEIETITDCNKTTVKNLTMNQRPKHTNPALEDLSSAPTTKLSTAAKANNQRKSIEQSYPQQSQVERVRLYQQELPPHIGAFESFPEPKPIQSPSQAIRTPIAELNPNLIRSSTFDPSSSHDASILKDNPNNITSSQSRVQLEQQQPEQNRPVDKKQSTIEINLDAAMNRSAQEITQVADVQSYNNDNGRHNIMRDSQHKLPDLPPLDSVLCSADASKLQDGSRKSDDNQSERPPVEWDQQQSLVPAHSDLSNNTYQFHYQDAVIEQMGDPQIPKLDTSSTARIMCDQNQPELWGNPDDLDSNESPNEHHEFPETHEEQNYTAQPDLCELASTWSKQGVAEFKDSLADDKHGGVYEVKEGTIVVIQVPTYPDGRYIYWEFATDDYDIGFGLEFVYEANLIQPLALNIYEESDEDETDLYDEGADYSQTNRPLPDWIQTRTSIHPDPEAANDVNDSNNSAISRAKSRRLANTITIVPTYRRNSHEEVFSGRHRYPGRGYYLLRFDNTYSVLRSKTLHFRICYFI